MIRRTALGARTRRIAPGIRGAARLATLAVVLCTTLWAVAFSSIYDQTHSRVAASEWMSDTYPARYARSLPKFGTTRCRCPCPMCRLMTACASNSVNPSQCTGLDFYPDEGSGEARLQYIARALNQSDYIVESSNRLYGSIPETAVALSGDDPLLRPPLRECARLHEGLRRDRLAASRPVADQRPARGRILHRLRPPARDDLPEDAADDDRRVAPALRGCARRACAPAARSAGQVAAALRPGRDAAGGDGSGMGGRGGAEWHRRRRGLPPRLRTLRPDRVGARLHALSRLSGPGVGARQTDRLARLRLSRLDRRERAGGFLHAALVHRRGGRACGLRRFLALAAAARRRGGHSVGVAGDGGVRRDDARGIRALPALPAAQSGSVADVLGRREALRDGAYQRDPAQRPFPAL